MAFANGSEGSDTAGDKLHQKMLWLTCPPPLNFITLYKVKIVIESAAVNS